MRTSGSEGLMPEELAGLVEAAKAGDQSAFNALVKATYASTYTLAYRLTGNEEDARDVVQDAYLRAYRGLERFRGEASFTTWLYRITANCANGHLSKRAKHRHDDLDDHAEAADVRVSGAPQDSSDNEDLRREISAALEGLPPKLRAVIVLRDIYDLPHEAIAAELGITEAAAKVRLHRARKKLRERLFPMKGEERAHAV